MPGLFLEGPSLDDIFTKLDAVLQKYRGDMTLYGRINHEEYGIALRSILDKRVISQNPNFRAMFCQRYSPQDQALINELGTVQNGNQNQNQTSSIKGPGPVTAEALARTINQVATTKGMNPTELAAALAREKGFLKGKGSSSQGYNSGGSGKNNYSSEIELTVDQVKMIIQKGKKGLVDPGKARDIIHKKGGNALLQLAGKLGSNRDPFQQKGEAAHNNLNSESGNYNLGFSLNLLSPTATSSGSLPSSNTSFDLSTILGSQSNSQGQSQGQVSGNIDVLAQLLGVSPVNSQSSASTKLQTAISETPPDLKNLMSSLDNHTHAAQSSTVMPVNNKSTTSSSRNIYSSFTPPKQQIQGGSNSNNNMSDLNLFGSTSNSSSNQDALLSQRIANMSENAASAVTKKASNSSSSTQGNSSSTIASVQDHVNAIVLAAKSSVAKDIQGKVETKLVDLGIKQAPVNEPTSFTTSSTVSNIGTGVGGGGSEQSRSRSVSGSCLSEIGSALSTPHQTLTSTPANVSSQPRPLDLTLMAGGGSSSTVSPKIVHGPIENPNDPKNIETTVIPIQGSTLIAGNTSVFSSTGIVSKAIKVVEEPSQELLKAEAEARVRFNQEKSRVQDKKKNLISSQSQGKGSQNHLNSLNGKGKKKTSKAKNTINSSNSVNFFDIVNKSGSNSINTMEARKLENAAAAAEEAAASALCEADRVRTQTVRSHVNLSPLSVDVPSSSDPESSVSEDGELRMGERISVPNDTKKSVG